MDIATHVVRVPIILGAVLEEGQSSDTPPKTHCIRRSLAVIYNNTLLQISL